MVRMWDAAVGTLITELPHGRSPVRGGAKTLNSRCARPWCLAERLPLAECPVSLSPKLFVTHCNAVVCSICPGPCTRGGCPEQHAVLRRRKGEDVCLGHRCASCSVAHQNQKRSQPERINAIICHCSSAITRMHLLRRLDAALHLTALWPQAADSSRPGVSSGALCSRYMVTPVVFATSRCQGTSKEQASPTTPLFLHAPVTCQFSCLWRCRLSP